MREQCVFLKNRIQLAFIGREIGNIFPVKKYLAAVRFCKTAKNPQCGSLTAAAGPQQGNKFIFFDIKIQIVQNNRAVK